jgi:hypothetical protein
LTHGNVTFSPSLCVCSCKIFDWLAEVLAEGRLGVVDRTDLRRAVIGHLPELVRINSAKASQLVLENFADEHERVLKHLDAHPRLQYEYLESLLGSESADRGEAALGVQEQELYIKLLCQFDPSVVCSFLVTHENYNLDYCLELCQKYAITDATAYLLEHTGDLAGALRYVLVALKEKLGEVQTLRKLCANVSSLNEVRRRGGRGTNAVMMPSEGSDDVTELEGQAAELVEISISLCQRNKVGRMAKKTHDTQRLPR